MKPVAMYPLMPEAANYRQPLGHLRHPAVKGGIKTNHLLESRVVRGHCINVFELTGQVHGRQGNDASQDEH